MGYTTKFEGEFHCYRAEHDELASFLKALRDGDRCAIAPLSDWLSDRSDPRGPVLASLMPQLENDLLALWRLFGLKPEYADYLRRFSRTRRMQRDAAKAERL